MATATARNCLQTCTVQQPRAAINRLHMSFHFIAILALLYYRISHLLLGKVPYFSWGLITLAELIFTFIWVLAQSFRWRPVVRTVNIENLPEDKMLPGVDVFICTADPKKEPVVEVMNTVLSAMALDYPPEKLAVYLSDDGGAALTLYAIKEACSFARSWLPFCRKYGIKTRSPEAYFSSLRDGAHLDWSDELREEEENIQTAYDLFKKNVESVSGIEEYAVRHDGPPVVEVIHDNLKLNQESEDKQRQMPLLAYVSREKRPSRPHRFKAGALNALLRVSGIMSNAPYLLVLDCDMYCNDPLSAQQAMCFHLDQEMFNSLAFVQFPQIFYNVSKNDIYDGQSRSAFKTKYQGMDGLRGTACSGTGYYLKKKALYCRPNHDDEMFVEPEQNFGSSRTFNSSLQSLNGRHTASRDAIMSNNTIIEEAKSLASCTFEENTKWGKEVGYSYESLLESSFTSYLLHNKGWKSVYLYPKRPAFLGCATIDMKDAMIQIMKWASGMVQMGLSKYSPLVHGISNMSIPQSMCYAYFTFSHFFSIACILYGIIPQLCFLKGVSLFPKGSNRWFAPFAVVYISSLLQHLYEVLSSGGSIITWWNEQRIWMIKSVTGCFFGCMDVLLKQMGISKANFRLTNKAVDKEKLDKYEKGKFDFQGATLFMIPLTLLVILNVVCFIVGVKRMISKGNFGEMFGQFFLSSYILALSCPILEGLVPKKLKKKH